MNNTKNLTKPLRWNIFGKYKNNVYSIPVPSDGSCLLHAICYAISPDYRTGKLNGYPFPRNQFVRNLRNNLADKLYHVDEENGFTYYENLKGFKDLAKVLPNEYSITALDKLFRSNKFLGDETLIILSYLLKVRIYILDKVNKNVIETGIRTGYERCIVILYDEEIQHFECVMLKRESGIHSVFFSHHDGLISLLESF